MIRKRHIGRKQAPSNKLEQQLIADGWPVIAGIDEVGRGAWAGPVVAAAVILTKKKLYKIRDSKLLTRKEREMLAKKIRRAAVAYSFGIVSVNALDSMGIGKASFLAMKKSISALKSKPDYLLIDGFKIPDVNVPQQAVVKGDQKVLSIAAASILAKVKRDKLMRKLHRENKECRKYRFDLNKGYPSPHHKKMLQRYGPCQWHRFSFTPVRQPKLQIEIP